MRLFREAAEAAMKITDLLMTPVQVTSAMLEPEVRGALKKIRGANPHPVSRQEALEIVSRTEWAQNWAKGMCSLAGIPRGTPEFEKCVRRLSWRVAEKII